MFKSIKTPADIEAEEQAQAADRARAEALAYLASTDWMVTRLAETGKPIPDDVAQAREDARKAASA